jgi:MYXO-CTERM domain-containing protein
MKLASLLILLLAASPAFAFVRTTSSTGIAVRWSSNDVHVEGPMTAPPGMTLAETNAAVAQAAAAWSAPACTSLRVMTSQSLGAMPQVGNDMHAQVIVRTDRWCSGVNCYDPQQLAITTVFTRAADGEIVDADIELNAVNHQWTNIPDSGVNPRPGAADLANVLTHELGHLLGLSDNCVLIATGMVPIDSSGGPAPTCATAPAGLREGTMFPDTVADDISKRTLADDDVRGICAIYPHVEAPADASAPPDAHLTITLDDGGPFTTPPPMSMSGGKGGCQVGGGTPSAGLGLALLALVARRRRRR